MTEQDFEISQPEPVDPESCLGYANILNAHAESLREKNDHDADQIPELEIGPS